MILFLSIEISFRLVFSFEVFSWGSVQILANIILYIYIYLKNGGLVNPLRDALHITLLQDIVGATRMRISLLHPSIRGGQLYPSQASLVQLTDTGGMEGRII